MKFYTPAFAEEQTGDRAVFSDSRRFAEKGLVDPFFQQRTDCGDAVCAQRAGGAENRADFALRAADEFKSENECDIQHPGDDSLFEVAYADAARNGADGRLGERRGNFAQRIACHFRVAVDGDDDIAVSNPYPFIERVALAAVAFEILGDDEPGELLLGFAHPLPGVVLRAVIHGDDFQFSRRVVARGNASQGGENIFAFIVGGNDDGAFRQLFIAQFGCFAVAPCEEALNQKVCEHQNNRGGSEELKSESGSVEHDGVRISREHQPDRSGEGNCGGAPDGCFYR